MSAGIIAAAIASGCSRPNPLYHADAGEAGTGGSGHAGATATAGDGGAGQGGTTGSAGTRDGGGGDASLGACTQGSDCFATRGAPVCGAWDCRAGSCAVVCGGCLDDDLDGYGVGAGCAGPDCDDNNRAVGRTGSRACYDGKGGTLGIGTCHAGAQLCTDGVWSTCGGQVLPSGEACNGLDDDCNGKTDDGLGTVSCGLGACAATASACAGGALGVCHPAAAASALDDCDGKDNDCDGAIDEDCATGCIRVSPGGDDQAGTGTPGRPFHSLQTAINFAAAVPTRARIICVAGGNTCLESNTYQSSDPTFTMANGISVYGNYEAKTWTRCPFGGAGPPNLTVTLQARSQKGVLFPASVTSPTTLDGVRVLHFVANGSQGSNLPTAAISVEGAKQVVLSNIVINDAPDVSTSYGVNLTGGAEALITLSSIFGGIATSEAIGVRSAASKPTLRDNCATIDPATGHCVAVCSPSGLGIHGRYAQATGATGVAIELLDSPGAIVERNAICGTQATTGVGVRISGAAMGTIVRGNSILAQGGTTEATGVSLRTCGDAAPWIVDNELIQADGTGADARVAGVKAVGACHPVIDGNTKITGGGEGMPATSTGVFCGADANVPSRCEIIGNKLIQGSPSLHPGQTYAVACDATACARLSGNKLSGQGGGNVVGLWLVGSGALVDRNDITGGCGTKISTGILAEDAFARLENNVVRGASCAGGLVTPETHGLQVRVAVGGNELDVHSNTIDAGGVGACQGAAAGMGLGATPGPKSPRGIFRDNILRAGACTLARSGFWEDTAGTSPRVFQRNDLDPTGAPMALYLRGNGQALATPAAVNALAGAAGNITADPMFVGPADLHLAAGSACVNAGTATGAPKLDFDGKARDDKPDIGAFER